MREGTKRNALMLTALVLGALVGGNTASAANLVAAIPSDYAHSQLGSITGSKVTTHVDAKASAGDLTGLNQDPALYPLWVNGEGDLYLRQYTYSTTDLLNSRLINGQGEWDDTSAPSGKITAVANAHAAAGYNGYMYATGYDNGKIGAATLEGTELKENTDNVVNLKEDIIKYTADGAAAGYTDATAMHGEGLITTDDGYLYAAVNVNKQGGYDDYDNGYLMQYKIGSDGKLTYSSYSRIGKNTDSVRINQYNNQFVLSAIGGYQNFGSGNADTAITINKVASPGKLNPTSTVIRKPDYVPYDFRDVKVLPNGTVYILTYNIGDGGSAINSKVYKTTMANLTNGNKEQWEEIISGSQEGWFGKLNAEYYTKRLWLEMGNTLSVYTDGSTTPAYTWESKDFSTDQQFYQFNSVAMIPSDRINGDLVQLTMYNPEGLTSSSESAMEIINPDTSLATPTRHIEITGVEAKDKGTYASETTDYSTYTFTKDEVVGVGITRTGDLKNNISADIYASDGNDITVNAGDHTLTLWANNYVSSPVGVYAGKGKSVTINAAQTNIVTSGYENGNSLTNAIWNDAAKDAASSITINGDTNIAMKGGYGGNGIAIQKTDRWGEASNETTQTSKITLNGDVVIAGENEDTWGIPANKENVYSRFNNSGILTSVDKSEVTVTGNAKLSVYGNGITTNAKDSKVSIGGGHIVVPKNTNYGYYTLGAYQGTINVNTGTTGNSPGANTVQLDGDIFALDTGTVNAALTTADSYLNGIVDNGGTANVWLQNGAEWFNAANNTRYKNDNEDVGAGGKSLVTKLVGGTSESTAGNIFQNDSNPLTIDNYSGYANIYYAHTSDGTNASDYAAGDTVIKKAASGSAVNMITANNGINMQDTDQVAGALNTLAGKLTYSGFGNGENNLTGKVKIADGLTASSAALRTGDIVFSDGTGKGTYVKSDDNEGGAITETTTLTNDYTATASEKNVQGSGSSMLISALYAGSSETASKEKPMVVDMNGHNLTLNAQGDGGVASAIVLGANQSIQIKNSDSKKQLTLKASHPDDTRAVNGIYVGGNNSSLTIDNPVVIEALSNTGRSGVVGINVLGGGSAGSDSAIDVIINGPLTIKGASSKNISAQTPANAGIKTVANGSAVTVNGSVDIEHVKGAALYTVGADSTISVAGGSITAEANPEHDKNYSAVRVDKGTVNLNMEEGQPGSNVTNVVGDFYLTKEYGKKVVEYSGGELIDFENSGVINAAFTTGDSSWTGAMTYIVDKDDYGSGGYTAHDAGNFNLWLQNGAIWNNEVQGGITPDESQRNTFNGSHVLNFTGGTEGHEGNIFQKDAKTLTIDNYSGSTNIFYAHTDDGTTADDYAAGDTIINKAATGSAVNMITDSSNITTTDDEQVAAVLNTLAGKLTYSAFASGEKNLTGTVKIAEGLTASSAEVKTGDITFQESNGKGSYVVPSKRLIFNTPITGQDDIDTEYVNAGVLKNDLYTFDKDSQIVIAGDSDVTKVGYYKAVGGILGQNSNVTIDAAGKTLSISSVTPVAASEATYGAYTGKEAVVTADKLKIETVTNGNGNRGIFADSNASFTINGDADIKVSDTSNGSTYGIYSYRNANVSVNGDVTMKGDGTGDAQYGVYSASKPSYSMPTGIYTYSGKVNIKGNADLAVKGVAVDARSDGEIIIESANIVTPADEETDYKAISAGGGTVTIGMNKEVTKANGEDVKIVGNIYATGTVNLGLGSGQSALKGVIENSDGTTKLFMENGASWNNVMVGHPGAFSGSHLTSINAGSSADTAGNIFQNDGNTLTIDNYSGYANIYYAHTSDGTEAADYAAGDTVIKKAASGSAVNMITANNGINMQDTDKVADALNALAGKLTYSGFASGEKNLTGKVKIADGLTASSAVLKTGVITFADDTGKGTYVKPVVPIEPKSEFSTAITGDKAVDTEYVHAGVLDDSNIYNFTEDKTTIDVETGYSIPGGPWMSKITALVSGKDDSHSVDVNMNGHDLTLRSSNSTVGIAAIGKGKVEVNNAGAIDIDVDTSGRAALYANGGGTIVVHNGGDNLENKVLKVRAEGSTPLNTAVIKTMNGVNNVHSSITIDGLVDVVADGETANEAVSAVASNIEIGGGHIEAKNGAWAAIRAYGEFVSQNYGIVNVNVAKDQNGNIIGSGENKTTIIGDIVTNGGMGTKGKISVGLNGKDSYWKGNYADTRGYGVTPGIEGAVNLYMENGSHWLGFGNGTMNVNMSGKDTYWTGFSIARNNGLRLTLNDGAVWYNAFSKGQTDKDGNLTVSRVTNLSGNGGIIDMSGSKGIYVADSTSLSGSPTKAGASGFAKDDSKTETGNAFIEKYSGNHTVIYKDNSFIDNTEREHALLYGNKEAHIAGGTFTIFKADAGSAITLLTGNNGINTSADATYVEKNQLNDTLNKLAEKLFYTANDGNLSGKVGIASGLTSSAAYAVVKSGDITFKDKGQGSYVYDLVKPSEQAVNPIDKVIDGSKDSQNYYEDIGIYNKNKNSYNFTKTPSDITASDKTDGVVHAKDGNLNIKANDTINISAGDNGVGVAAENGKKVILSGITNITASKALDANGEESAINMEAGHVRGTVTAENGGKITMDGAEVTGDITVADEKSSLNGTFKGGNGIQGKVTNNGEAVLTFTEGANWTGNSAGTGSTNVDIDKGSVWTGASANKGTNLDLKGTWKQTGESAVGQVISDNGTLDKTDSSSGKTSIQKLSGELNVTYGHNESDPTRIIGGDTVVASAASGSKINLITDSKGLKLDSNRAAAKNQVSETLNQLAHKLTYTADDNNLEGKVKIAEGLTSASAAMKAENITFDKNGVGSFVYDPVKNGLDIEYGSEETQMMRGTKSALFGAAMMWRSNSNDLQRRMGDIRLGQEESGVWAKYIGGKNEFNSQSTYMNQSYDIAQAGYDRKAGDWTVGIALDHGTGDVHYTGGKGDEKMTTLAVYGTKVSDDGKYVDIIIKSGKVSNDFEVSNEIGNELSGDYDTWGSSLSAEFGKRFIKDNGFYLDPSVEFTISRLNGKSFTGHSDLGELAVRQHAFNSAIGRIGLGIGRQTAKSNLYAKASLAHEFGGNFRTDFSADDGGAKGTKIDLQDTWMDLELGGSYSLNKNVYLYANYTRSFGAEMSTEWRADVGVRYSF